MAESGVPMAIRQLVQNQITGRRQSIGSRYDHHQYFDEKLRALSLWEHRLRAVIGRPPPSRRTLLRLRAAGHYGRGHCMSRLVATERDMAGADGPYHDAATVVGRSARDVQE